MHALSVRRAHVPGHLSSPLKTFLLAQISVAHPPGSVNKKPNFGMKSKSQTLFKMQNRQTNRNWKLLSPVSTHLTSLLLQKRSNPTQHHFVSWGTNYNFKLIYNPYQVQNTVLNVHTYRVQYIPDRVYNAELDDKSLKSMSLHKSDSRTGKVYTSLPYVRDAAWRVSLSQRQ